MEIFIDKLYIGCEPIYVEYKKQWKNTISSLFLEKMNIGRTHNFNPVSFNEDDLLNNIIQLNRDFPYILFDYEPNTAIFPENTNNGSALYKKQIKLIRNTHGPIIVTIDHNERKGYYTIRIPRMGFKKKHILLENEVLGVMKYLDRLFPDRIITYDIAGSLKDELLSKCDLYPFDKYFNRKYITVFKPIYSKEMKLYKTQTATSDGIHFDIVDHYGENHDDIYAKVNSYIESFNGDKHHIKTIYSSQPNPDIKPIDNKTSREISLKETNENRYFCNVVGEWIRDISKLVDKNTEDD
ncbi:MAG: hypothetical protein [Bacteriophage sp.]|nr:MAG: hypothetical protein [Bacteriophage sp.]